MTLAEFKAWFEGFTEDMDGAPSAKQFEKIKAKVADINGVAVTERFFVDRYIPPYSNRWPYVSWSSTAKEAMPPLAAYGAAAAGVGAIHYSPDYQSEKDACKPFNAQLAMRELGRLEAQA